VRVLFAAGGTGGHVFPAIAVAKAIRHLEAKSEILFVGTERGFEKSLVPQAGFKLSLVDVTGINSKGFIDRVKGILALPKAMFQSWRILSYFKPDVVFGIGGYASGPILLLASLRRKQTGILEPNSKSGFSNRVLGKFVNRIYLAFKEAAEDFPSEKTEYSGNPLRLDILSVPPPKFDNPTRTVLIFGGSQGAKRLNEAMVAALKNLAPQKERLKFIHQTGSADELKVREAYRTHGFQAQVFAFQEDMASLYRQSDFVIARSGSSVLEIAACGRPSILIPYPYAADDHQRFNARVMENAGAALYLEDEACSGPRLAQMILELLEHPDRLQMMRDHALQFRMDHAAERIAQDLLKAGTA